MLPSYISIVFLKNVKDVNLFELTADDDPMKVAEQVINSEPLVSEKKIDILTGKSFTPKLVYPHVNHLIWSIFLAQYQKVTK